MSLRDYEQELKSSDPEAYRKHCLGMAALNLAALAVIVGVISIIVYFK